jgi:hypothetical protein
LHRPYCVDIEIPRRAWREFLDSFSREHEGWLVTVEERPSFSSAQHVEARELPLHGVSADADGESIAVAVGDIPDQHMTHTIRHPARVLVETTDRDADAGPRIERRSGSTTRVMCRSAMRAEEIDGIP